MTPDNKHLLDVVAGVTAVGTLVGWLPSIAAALTIVWTAMRIYDWITNKVRETRTKY